MRYCKACLTTDLRPNASFSEEGICLACQYSESNKDKVGLYKLKLLRNKLGEIKSRQRNNQAYDCIVGVSGGKDSTRQAQWVRDRLGMNPLLVCCGYPPLQMSEVGADNLGNIISMGFDVVVATPAPQTSAALSLLSFRQYGNVCKSTEMALFSTVPRLAIDLGINLIFWGENPALQVGDSAVEGMDEFDGSNLRKLNTLTEGGVSWMHEVMSAPYKLDHYIYPHEVDFDKKKISIIYLGPAWDDWENEENATYASLHGLNLRPGEAHVTGDISEASMLDEEFTNINMMIKYFKFGFGRATDFVCEKIRAGKLSRDEGIKLVKQFDGVCDDVIVSRYCDYVGITVDEFWRIINKWVNKDIFELTGARPRAKFEVGVDYAY